MQEKNKKGAVLSRTDGRLGHNNEQRWSEQRTIMEEMKPLIIKLYSDERQTVQHTAARCGINKGTVRRWLIKWGVPVRSPAQVERYGRIDEAKKTLLIKQYVDEKMSAASMARIHRISPHALARKLVSWGVRIRTISESNRLKEPKSAETRAKLSKTLREGHASGRIISGCIGRTFITSQKTKDKLSEAALSGNKNGTRTQHPWKGKKRTDAQRISSMSISLSWRGFCFDGFEDVERILFLASFVTRHRLSPDCFDKFEFIKKFYSDSQFLKIYKSWIKSGKNKWYRPSLDHKTPISRGGSMSLKNLQFMTWFENRAKAEMTSREWSAFRKMTKTQSKLFI